CLFHSSPFVLYTLSLHDALPIFMVLGMVFVGAIASLPAIWNFADLSMGLMALVNLIAILILSPVALRILRDYERQIKEGKTGERSEEHTSELQSRFDLVCRLLLE